MIWTSAEKSAICPVFSSLLHSQHQGRSSKWNECPLWGTLSMHAHQHWPVTPNHIISAALHIPSLSLSSFLCILLTQLNPRTFLPLPIFLSPISFQIQIVPSAPSFFFYYDKRAAPELAPAGAHGNNPSTSSPFSFNPQQSFPKMRPTPLTPWLPFLLNWITADLDIWRKSKSL